MNAKKELNICDRVLVAAATGAAPILAEFHRSLRLCASITQARKIFSPDEEALIRQQLAQNALLRDVCQACRGAGLQEPLHIVTAWHYLWGEPRIQRIMTRGDFAGKLKLIQDIAPDIELLLHRILIQKNEMVTLAPGRVVLRMQEDALRRFQELRGDDFQNPSTPSWSRVKQRITSSRKAATIHRVHHALLSLSPSAAAPPAE